MEYKHTPQMGEISGFGGGYEATCQKMLHQGVSHFFKRRDELGEDWNPRFQSFQNVIGLCLPEEDNPHAKELEEAIMKDIDDATGAMFHTVVSRIFWIAHNGWDAYVKDMTEKKEEKQ